MLKLAGLLLLVLFGYGCGSVLLEKEATERRVLEELLRILSKMEKQIAETGLALPELYPALKGETLEKCGFLPTLRESASWQKAILYLPDLGEEAKQALERFAGEVGKSSRESELLHFSTLCSVLAQEADKRRAAAPTRIKLIRTLTLAFGAMIGLLLL